MFIIIIIIFINACAGYFIGVTNEDRYKTKIP